MLGPRQLWRSGSNGCLTSHCMMLSKNIKHVIVGFLVGLSLLLPVSGASACGRAHNRHALAVDSRATPTHGALASSVRRYGQITPSPARRAWLRATSLHRVRAPTPAAAVEPLRPDVSTAKASVLEATAQTASVHHVPVHEVSPSASHAKMELASSSPSSSFCVHAGGCGCCSANGGCCGMACCAAALPASAPTWPEAHGHAWAAPPCQLSPTANTDALFRPPCSSV
jgi:hypothetical protein